MTFAFAAGAPALAMGPQQSGQIAIHVERGAWGAAQVQDIEAVLTTVANVLAPSFPQHASDRIVVEYSKKGPQVFFKKSPDEPYRVSLNVQDTRWDQFTYQFSHELCHIFTNFQHREISDGSVLRDNQWFEETLCEAVSIYTLDQVAISWERSPPHPGWDEYAPAFRGYAQRLLAEAHRRLPAKGALAEWYGANQGRLAANPYLREENELLATRLLPWLENTPGSLKAIGYLNLGQASGRDFEAYLGSWFGCCPKEYRAFVSQVIALLGISKPSGASATPL